MSTEMNMIDYVKKAFNNYVNFKGRATRPEFWWFFLFIMIGYFLFAILTRVSSFFGIILIIFYLAILLPYLAVAVRRIHDVGKSGWFFLIPIYNLILLCSEGQSGPNEYGPDPKNPIAQGFDFEQQKLQP